MLVKLAAFEFKKGKTSADDLIVAEMLLDLSDDIFGVLAAAFQLRLLNHTSEDDDVSWDHHM